MVSSVIFLQQSKFNEMLFILIFLGIFLFSYVISSLFNLELHEISNTKFYKLSEIYKYDNILLGKFKLNMN
jgi:hypothetical protein